MIPYVIQQSRPNEDCRDNNIVSDFSSCDIAKLDEEIINYIIQVMYEFCSEKYGHGIKISSYDDFCEQYWNISGLQIRYWYEVFNVTYFKNNKWISWNIDEHKEEIYNQYVNKYQTNKN